MSSKLTPFDNQVFSDVTLTALVATTAGNVAVGGGVFAGFGLGLLAAIPALIVGAIVVGVVATPPTYLRALLSWVILAGIAAEAARSGTGSLTFGLVVGAAGFLYGGTRSLLVLRRGPQLPAAAAPAGELAPAPAPTAAEVPPVPKDLSPEVEAIAAAAAQDFRHLSDALSDPALARAAGVDAAGMRAEAGNLLRDILRRAPLVSRVRRIAAERPDDLDSRRAGDDALAALTRQADALRGATAAALRIAAAAQVDPSTLREHTENLHLLREAREESD